MAGCFLKVHPLGAGALLLACDASANSSPSSPCKTTLTLMGNPREITPAHLKKLEKLNQADVAGVEPTAHAFPLVNVTRPDETRPRPRPARCRSRRAAPSFTPRIVAPCYKQVAISSPQGCWTTESLVQVGGPCQDADPVEEGR